MAFIKYQNCKQLQIWQNTQVKFKCNTSRFENRIRGTVAIEVAVTWACIESAFTCSRGERRLSRRATMVRDLF